MRNADKPELLYELSEMIARDRQTDIRSEDVPETLAAWSREKAVTNRGLYAARPMGSS